MPLRVLPGLAVLLAALTAQAGTPTPGPLATFGEHRFPPLYREAAAAYVDASTAYRDRDYPRALATLDRFWETHPPGTAAWKRFQAATKPLHGLADFGTPPLYPALRMLTECARFRAVAGHAPPRETVRLSVVLVGQSIAPAPTTRAALRRGDAIRTAHTLDPALQGPAAARVLDETYWLFDEYLVAITHGALGLARRVVALPDVRAELTLSPRAVKLSRAETERVLAAVPAELAAQTDWWHLVYPSQVPTAAAFEGARFVTGGLRSGPRGHPGPCFVSEDLKLLRAPNQDGRHVLSALEREVALAQWLQHEFFHHVFRLFPADVLEGRPHQWQDRDAWPDDFTGSVEADYYAEALHKRLDTRKLSALLRGPARHGDDDATPPEPLDTED